MHPPSRKARYRISPVAKLLEYRMEERKVTWPRLAEVLNITEAMASHIRTGRRTMGMELMTRVSNYLDIPIPDLEYAQAVQQDAIRLSLKTMEQRAFGLALLRIWHTCSEEQLGRLHRVIELIHIEQVN